MAATEHSPVPWRSTAEAPSPAAPVSSFLLAGVWFGIVTGLLEGAGLLLFQRINWARWGPMVHVSEEIVWISPVVDTLLFATLGLIFGLAAKAKPRIAAMRGLSFQLTFLAVYDWLTLTERLYRSACALLALGVAVTCARWLSKNEVRAIRSWKRTTPWLIGAGVLAFAVIQSGTWWAERDALANLPPPPVEGAPNVLLIVVDTLRADHLSSYGYARSTTPNIDRVAGEGVLFQNAISTCSWTLPSHASLLTGRYPSEHGLANAQPIPWRGWGRTSLQGYPTLGEALEQRGYRTGAFSANQTYFTRNVGLGRGFSRFEDYFQSRTDMVLRTQYGREFARAYLNRSEKSRITRALRFLGLGALLDNRKRAGQVNREMLRWVDRDRRRPFFAFLNYIEVHDRFWLPRTDPKPSGFRAGKIDDYDRALNYVDRKIGKLLQELERRGLAENTLIIITSDHGEALGQHHLQAHGIALYRETIQVPLVICYPGHVPAAVRVSQPVSNVAIAATVMDLLGAGEPGIFPSPSLSTFWKKPGTEPNWPNPLSELAQNQIVSAEDETSGKLVPTAIDGAMQSLVTPQWHLIVHEKLGQQLYDWVHDAGEMHDLINTPKGRAAALRLTSQMEDMLKPHATASAEVSSLPAIHHSSPVTPNGLHR